MNNSVDILISLVFRIIQKKNKADFHNLNNQSKKTRPGFWDRVGIGLSGICAIHCLLVPVIVALMPLWPAFEEFHEYTHFIFFIAIAPAVYLSLRQKHQSSKITVLLLSGLFVIFLAWYFNEMLGEYGEAAITLLGSILLITGHWLNYKSKSKIRE